MNPKYVRNDIYYNLCKCGSEKQFRSPQCRKCWCADKKALIENGNKFGFKKNYIPWNKDSKGLTKWSPQRREKIMKYFFENGSGMKGKKQTLESRKKTSLKLLGEKNHNWQGGITHLNKSPSRETFEWKIWKEECFKRDNYTCRVCIKRGGRLELHHILVWSKYKEKRYEISNGITLCKDCHKIVFKKEFLFEDFFKKILETKFQNWEKELYEIKLNGVNSGNTSKN